jgi:hypothetical protein
MIDRGVTGPGQSKNRCYGEKNYWLPHGLFDHPPKAKSSLFLHFPFSPFRLFPFCSFVFVSFTVSAMLAPDHPGCRAGKRNQEGICVSPTKSPSSLAVAAANEPINQFSEETPCVSMAEPR